MDEFSWRRIHKLIDEFKKKHGRDISESELVSQNLDRTELDDLVRRGLVDKYQVTTAKGSVENRFKIHRDWRSLRN